MSCDILRSQVRMSISILSGSMRNTLSKFERNHGAVSRARTSDFKIFSLALSQLSYHGVIAPIMELNYKDYVTGSELRNNLLPHAATDPGTLGTKNAAHPYITTICSLMSSIHSIRFNGHRDSRTWQTKGA